MQQVTMLEFRKDAESILARVERGERIVLTRRGRPVARLEPIRDSQSVADDPIYRLTDLAEASGTLTNAEIDEAVYGQ